MLWDAGSCLREWTAIGWLVDQIRKGGIGAMEIKLGDRVKFKDDLQLGAGLQRLGQIGTVVEKYDDLPGQASVKVDIEFADGGLERGISVHQLEKA